jgi:hypothetical protein
MSSQIIPLKDRADSQDPSRIPARETVCGFTVSGLGATAGTNVTVTVGPLATSGSNFSYPYVYATGVAVLNTTLAVSYQPCIPGERAERRDHGDRSSLERRQHLHEHQRAGLSVPEPVRL